MLCYSCRPSSALTSSVQLEEEDIVVVATDGLFHNMSAEDIVSQLKDYKVRGRSCDIHHSNAWYYYLVL